MRDRSFKDSFDSSSELDSAMGRTTYFRLEKLSEENLGEITKLPFSIKILLEALLRAENGKEITQEDIVRLAAYQPSRPPDKEIPFMPARVLMQDFTGVPAVVDLAAMRSIVDRMNKDPQNINPILPVDLVIDHSVQVDAYGSAESLNVNSDLEFERNRERYEFLHWAQNSFNNFRVVPPANGICHQVNLEYLASVVQCREINSRLVAFPDSLVGTDSHTTMINGMGVLGWGVGGIEAEAAMLGQPITLLPPEVIGFKMTGRLQQGVTATDLVLTVTQMLREKGVVGKFVEFFGIGLSSMRLADRATISNMAPEYGATCGFFPVDEETLNYLRYTGRTEQQVSLVENYSKAQGLFRTDATPDPEFSDIVELDLSTVKPSLAGPKRPQDRIFLGSMKDQWRHDLHAPQKERGFAVSEEQKKVTVEVNYPDGSKGKITHGHVVIAAITSCTNTSNPWVLLGAGILAKKAVEAGLSTKPWVKTSLAPGSKVVTDYLRQTGLMPYLERLGFYVVGYGCTTCIGNSGPLPEYLATAVKEGNLIVAGVLSGNRNFEGRINPHTKANYLASPPLVVAHALAGTINIDMTREPLGTGKTGQDIYLKDIWPTNEEIQACLKTAADKDNFYRAYQGIEKANERWNKITQSGEAVYAWENISTYIQEPSFFIEMRPDPTPITPIRDARVLVKVANSLTTDHISPAGAIPVESPAGQYLIEKGVEPKDFNSYGSRRGNHEVMTRGTFANIRLKNELIPEHEGGWTIYLPAEEKMTIYDAAMRYKEASIPTIVLAGEDYGMGSSRDWAAKGTFLLGIKAVLAGSFERIHRSNLIGMGVLPLQFKKGHDTDSLGLTGRETYFIHIDDSLSPGQDISVDISGSKGDKQRIQVICRIDTPIELDYYRNGGILHMILRNMMREGS